MIATTGVWWLVLALAAPGDVAERCRAAQQQPRDAIAACDAASASPDVAANSELAEEMLFRLSALHRNSP